MLTFILAGGAPSIVVLVLGLVGVAAAGSFAYKPQRERLGYLACLGVALAAASVCGVALCLSSVARYVATIGENQALVAGIGESMSPAVLGFACVAIGALLTAVGYRRL